MLMDGRVKFFSLQNTAGVWQEKGVAVSKTIEVTSHQVSNIKKYTCNKTRKLLYTALPKQFKCIEASTCQIA